MILQCGELLNFNTQTSRTKRNNMTTNEQIWSSFYSQILRMNIANALRFRQFECYAISKCHERWKSPSIARNYFQQWLSNEIYSTFSESEANSEGYERSEPENLQKRCQKHGGEN
ncbi:hypothetical protein Tcan_06301 [Toxocara canis]|uniref:Uncharacterized protein n=1 Tax=Toxocara canis TaxID=6265 RepID=A0A0B2US89_TOXCA|nr:hypothetical protein Tcan_06301 [Toxocara canis]